MKVAAQRIHQPVQTVLVEEWRATVSMFGLMVTTWKP